MNLDSSNDFTGKILNSRFCTNSSNARGGNSPADFSRSIGRSQVVGHGPNILSATASKLVRTAGDVTAAMEAYPLPSTSSLGGEKENAMPRLCSDLSAAIFCLSIASDLLLL